MATLTFVTIDGTAKAGLEAARRGTGGTRVRIASGPRKSDAVHVAKDLMNRGSYDIPFAIGVGLPSIGTAFRVMLCDVEVVR